MNTLFFAIARLEACNGRATVELYSGLPSLQATPSATHHRYFFVSVIFIKAHSPFQIYESI